MVITSIAILHGLCQNKMRLPYQLTTSGVYGRAHPEGGQRGKLLFSFSNKYLNSDQIAKISLFDTLNLLG